MRWYIFNALILTTLLASCNDNAIYDDYETLPQNGWSQNEPIEFMVKDVDTFSMYNAFINLRNNSDYQYSNLFLITELNFPNGKVVTDTLEYTMAFPNGNYLGNGFGDVKENKLWYKENITFPESGKYTIKIRQAMRQNGSVAPIEILKGITEVGFRLEPVLNTK